jgi:uncharacterized protein
MPVLLNLHALTDTPVALEGLLPLEELDWGGTDDLVALAGPLHYRLTVQREGEVLLLLGALEIELECQCARCLKPFRHRLSLEPWSAQLALGGPEAIPVVGEVADLTASLREDTLLALPLRPLCAPECGGLRPPPSAPTTGLPGAGAAGTTVWSELDKLNL